MTSQPINDPFEPLLNRDLAVSSIASIIGKYSPYLRDLINYGTKLLIRCERSLSGVAGTPSSLIHLYYHVLQVADGIEVLASNACAIPGYQLYRSLLEANVSIEYMLQEDFESRSTAWMVSSLLSQRRFLESLDESTVRGKELLAMALKDRRADEAVLKTIRSVYQKEHIEGYDKLLLKPKFADVANQMTGPKRVKEWYSINGGPPNLKALMLKLDHGLEYEIYYAHESELHHAEDSNKMLSLHEGTPVMTPIRPGLDHQSVETLYVLAGTKVFNCSIMVANKLRPDEPTFQQFREIVRRHRPEAITD